ncbi:SAM-dependent methyltransferase [Bradyrhizobium sp. SSBR45G]|uniref:Eco57I restriction-modification methylase domain-containing protein n=1 Tax=unclassified Bradyrhizobium TaxID=2631580 RepID=UPI002342965E|nr:MULTISPECIES: Eco57I restriction-modification methylase domain-containing protein [unclassified Bradyrhizobium]GLH79767.1 SAM-dependent methyltransferase [Bradyrhizobium sp. SSBR45G]GLH87115.1 SAM-dependent methyltransferase [Bradyrhizobium sp. SSBR45R]
MDSTDNDLFGDREIVAEPERKPKSKKSELGQFFTGERIAAFMAGLFPQPRGSVRLLDAGAGQGALTKAFVETARSRGFKGRLEAHVFEKDEEVIPDLRTAVAGLDADGKVFEGDFIERAATMIKLGRGDRYTHSILNPPYGKINTGSAHRGFLRTVGLETVNLYPGFVGLAFEMLADGGELVAIIPRSFCNGPYYLPFRRWMFARGAILHIHLFESRNKAFKSDGVLQENIIIHMKRSVEQGDVKVTLSTDDTFEDLSETTHPFGKIVYPDDPEAFIHIPTGDDGELLSAPAFGHTLKDLGLAVATGPVVDFRLRGDMCAPDDADAVPLLYTSHFVDGELVWPKENFKKSNAIRRNANTEKWMMPFGVYTIVKRFSSKEERRRIVANVVDPARLPANEVLGFENHLNVIHKGKKPLPEDVAQGIAVFLNSTAVDRYFRRFNGHTQVNATDLRTMRFPSIDAIRSLGTWVKELGRRPTDDEIDRKIESLA